MPPLTVIIATKDERPNILRCLDALRPAARVYVVDSHSRDGTAELARQCGAHVVQFDYQGGPLKKRQWALENLAIETPWVLLIDADEVVPRGLWSEIEERCGAASAYDAYLIKKQFHFLGRRLHFGGFSHEAVLLFRRGVGRFEQLVDCPEAELDMEVHERILVEGRIGRLRMPLIHDDCKGLSSYIQKHNRYSSWEAALRHRRLATGSYGPSTIQPRLLGNVQERRRWLKAIAMHMPGEAWLWFAYHYLARLGFLEGRRGLIASGIRAEYIRQVRAKTYELALGANRASAGDRGSSRS